MLVLLLVLLLLVLVLLLVLLLVLVTVFVLLVVLVFIVTVTAVVVLFLFAVSHPHKPLHVYTRYTYAYACVIVFAKVYMHVYLQKKTRLCCIHATNKACSMEARHEYIKSFFLPSIKKRSARRVLKFKIVFLLSAPQDCAVCGKLATFNCTECCTITSIPNTDRSGNYCKDCNTLWHSHAVRSKHKYRPLRVSPEICAHYAHRHVEHQEMELFAIVCIETSHYVTFAKCPDVKGESTWCFFDSMADRVGEFAPKGFLVCLIKTGSSYLLYGGQRNESHRRPYW